MKKKCQHHWIINDEHFGKCKKCQATKQFMDNLELDVVLQRKVHRTYTEPIPKEIKEEMEKCGIV
jgi:hypothetical protein